MYYTHRATGFRLSAFVSSIGINASNLDVLIFYRPRVGLTSRPSVKRIMHRISSETLSFVMLFQQPQHKLASRPDVPLEKALLSESATQKVWN